MQSDKKYLEWCAKQKKGIALVKESENLQKAYVKKSKEALKSMELMLMLVLMSGQYQQAIMQNILSFMHYCQEWE